MPELVVTEKGESTKEEALPELVVTEKGESTKEEALSELVVTEKGESTKEEALPELVVTEKGEALIQESAPIGKTEKFKDDKSGVEVELFNNKIDNISLNVKTVKDAQQLSSISKELSVDKDKVRILDLKLSKGNNVVHLNNERIVRIALLENESSEIQIYHVDKTGKLTLIPSEVNNKIVQFNINHFSLFAIVDFTKIKRSTEEALRETESVDSEKNLDVQPKDLNILTNHLDEKLNVEKDAYSLNTNNEDQIANLKVKKIQNEPHLDEKSQLHENNLNDKYTTQKVDALSDNHEKKEALPKTGETSSEQEIALAGIGLMVGLLGVRRKYSVK